MSDTNLTPDERYVLDSSKPIRFAPTLDLRAVEARLKAAKRGPWHMAMPAIEDCPEYDSLAAVEASSGECVIDACDDTDAAFISNAPTDVVALLAHCRALRAALEPLATIRNCQHDSGDEYRNICLYCQAKERAAAVLAQATDEEGK